MWYPRESYQQFTDDGCEESHSCQQQCRVSVYGHNVGSESSIVSFVSLKSVCSKNSVCDLNSQA